MSNIKIKSKNLDVFYGDKQALFDVNLDLNEKEVTALIGPSGCGKSTLLNILGLLDSNFEGQFLFEGKATNSISNNQLSIIRNKKIGFIHQFFNLIPELSVLENVILPGLINKNKESVVSMEAYNLLDTFGILDKKDIKPNKLSGGEQQRVASARALINKPDLILADEMTGNLDDDTSDEIINFFLKFIDSNRISLLYVTHNQKYADMADNKYEFKNKKLILK